MEKLITQLQPAEVWEVFAQILQIPRPSYHEEKIRDFVENFGKNLGLETLRDDAGNIIIRKPATPGMENRKGVILQGHLDMVPQKNSDKTHDFENDPIEGVVDGEWVKANGTTLGADNGIGVSAILAVLASQNIVHGPVEALFTATEETGMDGANGLKAGLLQGDILINTDSEDEGELYIGCAGGVDSTGEFKFKLEATPADHKAYRIVVKGLKGGHSGLDIHLGRGNANKIINTLMLMAADKVGLRVSQVDGGSLRNAIPREAFATIVVPAKNAELFEQFTAEFEAIAKDEFAEADGGLSIQAEAAELPENVVDMKTQNSLFEAVAKCPNGVIAMSKDMEGVVETSTNLATVKMNDGQFVIGTLQRSSVDADKEKLAAQIRDVFEKAGGKAYSSGDYPGWKPNVKSPILHAMKDVYNNKFGKVPEVKVIHAGLECGILGSAYPNWDMISFGPTIRHPHSPDEKVNIDTVKLFWEYLVETLKHAPKK